MRNSASGVTVPENDIRGGDFSRFLTAAQRIVINDPSTGQPFPNNVIPTSRINPVSKGLLDKYIPAPNVASNLFFYLQDNAPEISRTTTCGWTTTSAIGTTCSAAIAGRIRSRGGDGIFRPKAVCAR